MPVPALELKGRMLSVTRINATTDDLAAIEAQLTTMAQQMPAMVQGMTAVLETSVPLALADYLAAVRRSGMKVVGVSGALLAEAAADLGLPVLPPDTGTAKTARSAPEPAPEPERPTAAAAPVAAVRPPSRLIAEPIRGGQQVYARGTDLTITHQVGAGAEVVADGSIHIYGRLAGRAIAGADGDPNARIYCRRFEPELVAIAGVYAVAEQLHGEWLGKPAQVFLQDGTLKVMRID